MEDLLEAERKAREELEQWVTDLQSGMYVNCVYCGHRYGPNETTPVTMADALKEHIEQCSKHPMSELKQRAASAEARLREVEVALVELVRLKALKESCANFKWNEPDSNIEYWQKHDDYQSNQPKAWQAAVRWTNTQ